MEAVDSLGYTPNFNARAMAAKRTFTIGAIIPTMENAIFARGLEAFQTTLRELGYNLLVSSNAYQPDLEAEQIRSLVARGADGLLVIGYERNQSVYDYLEGRGIPVVIAWSYAPDSPHPSIGFDNRASMFELAEKVICMGHTDIAYISGFVDGNDRAADRLQGIKDGLIAHGLDPDEMHIIQTSYEIENGGLAFEKLMQLEKRPSVVMCGNDVLAAGATHKAHELGINIPGEVSITGFDDIELASLMSPALTTVHVPHRKMGSEAAAELVKMIEKKSIGVSQKLDSSLRLRASLKPK